MNKTFPKVFSLIVILALVLGAMPVQSAQALGGGSGSISLTTIGTAYTQNFDTLANTGSTNNLAINGWYLNESGTSGNNNAQYQAGTGSNNAGDTYSFGASASAERAFGGLLSGTLNPTIGAQFTNNTTQTVTALDISYTGEMWRAGVTNRNAADRLDFQLSTNATSLTTGTWTDYNNLDFNSPNINATAGALNGNSVTNQASISFSITGLSILPGSSFWIRWLDFDISSSDDGLAVDSFSITPRIVDFPPEVVDTFPDNGATDFPVNANLTVTFSEPVNVTSSWFTLVCSVTNGGNAIPTAFSGGPTTFTLDPGIALTHGENCTLTVLASQVSDVDANDPPNNMVFNFTVGFSPYDVCATPFTSISAIQGDGLVTPIPGVVTTKGVVVGDFEGSNSVGIGGFYLQDLSGDGNSATSDGIFVYTGSSNLVSVGQVVRVTGYARERFSQTTLNGSNSDSSAVPAANITSCGTGSVTATDVFMPFADTDYLERFEGMLVRFPQSLVISEYFNYDRFGEMVIGLPLDGYDRFYTPTGITNPGPAAQALLDEYALRRITLDDGLGSSGPTTLRHPNGNPFSATNRFRGGDTVTDATGVLGYDFGLYRIQPTAPATYNEVNPRPASPSDVGGTIKVASYNVLNYFLTIDTTASNNSGPCGPLTSQDCRGADSTSEFARQRSKLMQALTAIDADIYGLIELENTADVETLGDIVDGLNAIAGPGTFASIDTGIVGGDAIRVGIIYKPGKVTPVGAFQTIDEADDPRFNTGKNRPSLAQTFQVNDTGARFTVVVNHFKSKGSDCDDVGDPDTGDGQGNCNLTRLAAAQALVDWLATDPTGSGDPDFLVIGDMNSYAKEDPIAAIKAGSDDMPNTGDDYMNLVESRLGALAYSYVFDGQAGYLDHALASNSLNSQVTGVTDWHLNADEPDIFDYNDAILTTGEQSSERRGLDVTDVTSPFRTSDHDPVIVGLNPRNDPPVADAGGPYTADEGQSVTLTATGYDPDTTPVTFAWDLNNDNVFETPGQTATFSAVDGTFDYTVNVQVTDATGLSTVASAVVHVNNVNPDLGVITAPLAPVQVNTTVNATANFTDPGVLDTHTISIDWGDGNITAGTVSETNGSGSVDGSHAYTTPGVYTITITVTDKDGGSDTSTFEFVVVYDPNGGFVTGGGWINSPAGAYTADPSLTGKATFGFVAKYQKGANVPVGNTEFQFKASDLNFKSTSYEWLVVAGSKAQFKGEGTINGEGSYKFMITANDGNPDTFRIKIWYDDESGEHVVYDNGSQQPLGGGSIVVHK